MIRVGLRRLESTDEGTFGVFIISAGVACYSLELPWRDNLPNLSCIPVGEYLCRPRNSPRFGKSYHVTNVPDRSYVLIHSANLAGNVEKGYKSHLAGCIAPGQMRGKIDGQKAVLASRSALSRLQDFLDWQEFTLVVEDET